MLEEHNTYDKFGRLTKKVANGKTVEYKYDDKNRLMEQIANGVRMTYEYTPLGQLSRKTLWDTNGKTLASLNYIHGKDGKIMGRTVNGKSQHFQYDQRNQLVAVLDGESKEILERYNYDPAGNILKKTVLGKTTSYTYDRANQLVQSIANNGQTTDYAYDAAGRMIKEGAKSYTYGYMDKVMSVFENGQELASFEYDQLGQIAKVIRPGGEENFVWDGLSLIARNDIDYVNERHAGGGSPILAGNKLYFNDLLASTQGEVAQNDQNETTYIKHSKSSFGTAQGDTEQEDGMFTGKPYIKELGYAFWGRNYRPDLGKWTTADPLGYPDGTNNFAYCNNDTANSVDLLGLIKISGVWVMDINNNYNLVSDANDLSIGSLSLIPDDPLKGGRNEAYVGGFVKENNEIYLLIHYNMSLVEGLPKLESFDSGRTIVYKKHIDGKLRDAYFPNGSVYEPALAHERGHAQAFFEYILPCFENKISNMDFDDSLDPRGLMARYVSWTQSALISAINETAELNQNMSNEATKLGFDSSRIFKDQGVIWRWTKE